MTYWALTLLFLTKIILIAVRTCIVLLKLWTFFGLKYKRAKSPKQKKNRMKVKLVLLSSNWTKFNLITQVLIVHLTFKIQ